MKRFLIIAVCVIVVGAGGAYYFFAHKTSIPSRSLVANKPDLVTHYDAALDDEKKIAGDAQNPQWYLAEALEWKTIGDQTNDDQWYKAAAATYERGIVATGRHNTLLMANVATIYEKIQAYDQARAALEEAIQVAPGESTYYVSLVTLLRQHYEATPQTILPIFNDAITHGVSSANLFMARMEYLTTIGRYDDAIADLELLHNAHVFTDDVYTTQLQEINQLKTGTHTP